MSSLMSPATIVTMNHFIDRVASLLAEWHGAVTCIHQLWYLRTDRSIVVSLPPVPESVSVGIFIYNLVHWCYATSFHSYYCDLAAVHIHPVCLPRHGVILLSGRSCTIGMLVPSDSFNERSILVVLITDVVCISFPSENVSPYTVTSL